MKRTNIYLSKSNIEILDIVSKNTGLKKSEIIRRSIELSAKKIMHDISLMKSEAYNKCRQSEHTLTELTNNRTLPRGGHSAPPRKCIEIEGLTKNEIT